MEYFIALGTAFWLGILTSVSPCPLATNIAAVSFISKKIQHKRTVFFTGLLYTLGRIFAYVLLAYIVIKSILAIPSLSLFLQTQMLKIVGPLLIITGMFLLELITIPLPSVSGTGSRFQKIFHDMGVWGAFPLGALFAFSFCPVSAALFFGSLIPLATKYHSTLILPSIYGIGTGLPVFIFAILIMFGVSWVGRLFNKIGKIEYWTRIIVGILMIGVGLYLVLIHIFKI